MAEPAVATPVVDATTTGGKPQEQPGVKPVEELGTTAKLFPEFAEKPEAPEAPAKPAEIKPPEEEALTLDSLKGKKVKVKIDGVESIVNAEDLWKGYQTDQHLSQKGQKIGEDLRALAAERARLATLQTPPPKVEMPAIPADNPWAEEMKPFIEPLQQKIASLESQLANVGAVIAPVNYQNTIEGLDKNLKAEGFEDFKIYLPKVEEYILALPANVQANYDNAFGFATVYKHLKSADLMKEITTLKAEKVSTPIRADERPKPPVVVMESGTNAHVELSPSQEKYTQAFELAKKTGDWTEVYKLKGVIP